MTEMNGTSRRGLSRRRALQAGVVGGTALWVVPTIDSLYTPAAAASNTGPCAGGAQTIDWSTFPNAQNGNPGSNAGFPYSPGTFGGTIVTFQLISAGTLVWGTGESGVQNSAQLGNLTGQFQLYKNVAPVGDTTLLRMRFNKIVKNLDFRITDIDISTQPGNNFVDQITVAPYLNGVATSSTFTPDSGTPSFTPPGATTATTTTRTGSAAAAANSNVGNLRVQGPASGLDRVDISYVSNQAAGAGTTQVIGISDISWSC